MDFIGKGLLVGAVHNFVLLRGDKTWLIADEDEQ